MRSSTLLKIALLVSLAGLVFTLAERYRLAIDHTRAVAYGRDVRQLPTIDARLSQELLRSRSGLVTHYDTLVRNVKEMQRLVRDLALMPSFLDAAANVDLRDRLQGIAALVEAKEGLIESFKSDNAVLGNSRRFLPVAARALGERPPPSAEVDRNLHLLLATLMQLDAARDRDIGPELRTAIGGFVVKSGEETRAQDDEFQRALTVLLRHTGIVAERKPIVDGLVDEALSVPLPQAAAELEDAYSSYYQAALRAESTRQKSLFGFASAAVILGLGEVILRLRRGRAALEQATRELTSVNIALAKEQEKEKELGEMKTRFVSMVSHEFRNPVAAILSSSELLERYGEHWDNARKVTHFERIREASAGMSQLLDEILLIGRGEAGLLNPAPAAVHLDELCAELVQAARNIAGHDHVIRHSLTGDPNVVLDARLLRHLLANLLENAVKYSPNGGEIVLDVDARDSDVRFALSDRGIGIAREDLPHLYSTFRRGTNVGKVPGSGLGLAVVKHVVEALGGTIDVKTEVGHGTEFVVVLPLRAANRDAASGEVAALEAS